MISNSTKNLIIRLRTIREERHLSIADLMAQTNLSESTIRRVFIDDIEKLTGFNSEGTLMPLCELLLPKGDLNDKELSEARIEGLVALVEVKDEIIEDLKKQMMIAAETQQTRCKKCEKDVEFLRNQIDLKDHRMDKKDEWIDHLMTHIDELINRLMQKTI